MVSTDSIRELAEPVLASAGLELWDVEIDPGRGPDHGRPSRRGTDLDADCARRRPG